MLRDSFAFGTGVLAPFVHRDALPGPESLFADYFDSSSVGLCILDLEFRFLAINNTLAEINGIPAQDHIGKTVREILGDFADVVEPELRRVISTGEPVVNLEGSDVPPTRTRTGQWVGSSYPIKDATGAVTRIGVVLVEVTAQKKLHQSLQQVGGRLRKEMSRLQMLLDVSTILASNWNLYQVFPQISARIRRVLRQEYAGFELHDASTGLLVRQAEDFPLGKGLLSSLPISPHDSPGGRSLREGTPLIFSKSQIQSFDAEIAKNFLAEGFRSLCCVPLVRPKGALGVLVLGSTRKNAFQPEDLDLLKQVASQFARSARKPSRGGRDRVPQGPSCRGEGLPRRRASIAGYVRRNRWRQPGAQEGPGSGGDGRRRARPRS